MGLRKFRFVIVFILLAIMFTGGFAQDEDDNESTDKMLKTGIISAAGAVGLPALGKLVGFGAAGIVKGSFAAGFQSVFGPVLGFSTLQSIGATGMMAATGPIGIAGAGIAGAVYYFYN